MFTSPKQCYDFTLGNEVTFKFAGFKYHRLQRVGNTDMLKFAERVSKVRR